MSVSVVVRTKDRPALLARALKNVLEQSFSHYEILVVNDGGTASAVDEVCSALGVDAKVRVISHERSMGRGAALRTGIEQAERDLLTVHDDDDLWHPQFLEKLLSHYVATKEILAGCVGAISSMTRRIEVLRDGQLATLREESPPGADAPRGVVNVARYLTFQEDFFPIQAVFEKAAALRHVGLLSDMHLFEDRLLFSNMLLGGEFAVLEEVLAIQSVRADAAQAGMNDTSRREIDFYFALLQNRLLRSAGPAAGSLAFAPFAHEIRRAVMAPRHPQLRRAVRNALKLFQR